MPWHPLENGFAGMYTYRTNMNILFRKARKTHPAALLPLGSTLFICMFPEQLACQI
jgi:hypothetical protein